MSGSELMRRGEAGAASEPCIAIVVTQAVAMIGQ